MRLREHPECFTEAQKVAEFIFPELAESEDERIRKVIYELVEVQPTAEFIGDVSKDECLTWLKKQKEQKILPPISSGTRYYFDEWLQLQTMPKLWDAFLAGIDFNKKERTPSAEETELNSAAFLEQLGTIILNFKQN